MAEMVWRKVYMSSAFERFWRLELSAILRTWSIAVWRFMLCNTLWFILACFCVQVDSHSWVQAIRSYFDNWNSVQPPDSQLRNGISTLSTTTRRLWKRPQASTVLDDDSSINWFRSSIGSTSGGVKKTQKGWQPNKLFCTRLKEWTSVWHTCVQCHCLKDVGTWKWDGQCHDARGTGWKW